MSSWKRRLEISSMLSQFQRDMVRIGISFPRVGPARCGPEDSSPTSTQCCSMMSSHYSTSLSTRLVETPIRYDPDANPADVPSQSPTCCEASATTSCLPTYTLCTSHATPRTRSKGIARNSRRSAEHLGEAYSTLKGGLA